MDTVHECDRRTDGRTDRQTELRRPRNALRRAVKTENATVLVGASARGPAFIWVHCPHPHPIPYILGACCDSILAPRRIFRYQRLSIPLCWRSALRSVYNSYIKSRWRTESLFSAHRSVFLVKRYDKLERKLLKSVLLEFFMPGDITAAKSLLEANVSSAATKKCISLSDSSTFNTPCQQRKPHGK